MVRLWILPQRKQQMLSKRWGRTKAVGPDNILIEIWRSLGEEGICWLTNLFNAILRSRKMPEEWRISTLIPIYKNKGDVQVCENYRGIKLLSHTMKLWERVIERRIRQETVIRENQFGFMPGKSTTEAIHIFRRLMEKYRERIKICIWCSSTQRKRMIAYHEASFGIASRVEVSHKDTLRQYWTCMTEYRPTFLHQWV